MRKPILTVLGLVLALGGAARRLWRRRRRRRPGLRWAGQWLRGLGIRHGSGSGTAAAECTPVGEDLVAEADETVDLEPARLLLRPPTSEVAAGIVTFPATNEGTENHELAFLPGGGDVPFIEPGVPDEDALADAGAFELEGFRPGPDL